MDDDIGASDEAIRVFVRVRPAILSEISKEAVSVEGNKSIHLKYDKYDISCQYGRVFGKICGQEEIFAGVRPLLRDALRGVNCSIFAYGQTSAGKTHTM